MRDAADNSGARCPCVVNASLLSALILTPAITTDHRWCLIWRATRVKQILTEDLLTLAPHILAER